MPKNDFSSPSEGNYPRQIFFEYTEKRLTEFGRSGVNFSKIIEVGCGDGVAIARLAQKFPNFSFLGIDLQSGAIDAARSRYGHLPNLSFSCTDVSSKPDLTGLQNTLVLSCATLIYLSPKALTMLLDWPGLARIMICEIASTGRDVIKENIFIHPYELMFLKTRLGSIVTKSQFDYIPWSPHGRGNHAVGSNAYTGAIFEVEFSLNTAS